MRICWKQFLKITVLSDVDQAIRIELCVELKEITIMSILHRRCKTLKQNDSIIIFRHFEDVGGASI